MRASTKKDGKAYRAVIKNSLGKVIWEGGHCCNRDESTIRSIGALDMAKTVLRAINGDGDAMREELNRGYDELQRGSPLNAGNLEDLKIKLDKRTWLVEYAIREAEKFHAKRGTSRGVKDVTFEISWLDAQEALRREGWNWLCDVGQGEHWVDDGPRRCVLCPDLRSIDKIEQINPEKVKLREAHYVRFEQRANGIKAIFTDAKMIRPDPAVLAAAKEQAK